MNETLRNGGAVIEVPTEVPGLVLRKLSVEDVDAYYSLVARNREHLTSYGDYQELREATVETVRQELGNDEHRNARFGIWMGVSLVGRFDLSPRQPGHFVLGYWLDLEHTGQGYATAAGRALIDYAQRAYAATDVWAGVTKGNQASEALLMRLGLVPVADMGTYTRFHRGLREAEPLSER